MAPPLIAGAFLSVPLSAVLAKRADTARFTLVVGISTVILGCLTLYKAFF